MTFRPTTSAAAQRRMDRIRDEAGMKPIRPQLPPPVRISFDGREFFDVPERHGMTSATYCVTLESIRTNMRTFMSRRFSVVSETNDTSLAEAPVMLDNYLTVESLIRGFVDLPLSVRLHLLENVLGDWGFQFNGKTFAHPGQAITASPEQLVSVPEPQ